MFIRILCFWAVLFTCATAMAAEPLIFRDTTRNAREVAVLDYLASRQVFNKEIPYRIAEVDLNGDGVNEWIVRQDFEGCTATAACEFSVTGLSDKTPALLGTFNARKIGISDEKTYGVRKLLVYDLKNDDFSYTEYVWSPPVSAFRAE